jgi:hypothetical protein
MTELGDAGSPASTAYRQRIREHFNQLYDDTAALQAELDDLAREASTVTDADLIAQLPFAPARLIEAPDEIREALCAAMEVQAITRRLCSPAGRCYYDTKRTSMRGQAGRCAARRRGGGGPLRRG